MSVIEDISRANELEKVFEEITSVIKYLKCWDKIELDHIPSCGLYLSDKYFFWIGFVGYHLESTWYDLKREDFCSFREVFENSDSKIQEEMLWHLELLETKIWE